MGDVHENCRADQEALGSPLLRKHCYLEIVRISLIMQTK